MRNKDDFDFLCSRNPFKQVKNSNEPKEKKMKYAVINVVIPLNRSKIPIGGYGVGKTTLVWS